MPTMLMLEGVEALDNVTHKGVHHACAPPRRRNVAQQKAV